MVIKQKIHAAEKQLFLKKNGRSDFITASANDSCVLIVLYFSNPHHLNIPKRQNENSPVEHLEVKVCCRRWFRQEGCYSGC